jgi:hypothetical protein
MLGVGLGMLVAGLGTLGGGGGGVLGIQGCVSPYGRSIVSSSIVKNEMRCHTLHGASHARKKNFARGDDAETAGAVGVAQPGGPPTDALTACGGP